METRYLCKIKAVLRDNYGKPREARYGNTVEFVWLDERSDFHRSVMVHTWAGEAPVAGSNELMVYHGLKSMLAWLIANNKSNENISLYVDSRKVANQMGPKNSRVVSSNDYADIAKQCKSMVPLFTNLTFHLVPSESLFPQQQVAEKG